MDRIQGGSLDYYLDKLVLQRTKGNDEIRIYNIRKPLRKKLKMWTLKDISDICDIKYKNIQNWLGESERDIGIPISQAIKITKIMRIRREELFEESNIFGGTNTKKYKLPKKITPLLAYLLGYIMGDGHLADPSMLIANGSRYNAEIRITSKEKSYLLFLRNIFNETFGYDPPLFKEKNYFRLIGRSKVIHRFFYKICGVPVGNKKKKTCVLKIVKSNAKLKRFFLSGFFDSDGTVSVAKNKIIGLRIKQYNRGILVECKKILVKEGLRSIGIYKDYGKRNGKITRAHVLAIQNKHDIGVFINKFFSFKIQDAEARMMKKSEIPKHIAIIPDGNHNSNHKPEME